MVDVGSIGMVMYSTDRYIFIPISDANVGEKGLIVPLANNEYRVVKLAASANVGDTVIVVHDRKSNYYALLSGEATTVTPEEPISIHTPAKGATAN